MPWLEHWATSINNAVAASFIGKHFRLEGSSHKQPIYNSRFLTEVRAGITTFFTLSYVIAVNATVLADSGGPCVCTDPTDSLCRRNPEYLQCVTEVHRDMITATAAISCMASCLFGILTNLPVALAPGMGLNAYFAYQVVGFHGSGRIPYQLALTAIFIEGFVFIFLSLTGLSYGAGIGAVTGAVTTPLDIGGCPDEYRDANTGMCLSHKMQSPKMWIGIMLGGILTAYLMSYKVKSAITIGILLVAITAWPRDTSFTMFPRTIQGDLNFDYFKQVVNLRPIKLTLNALEWNLRGAGGEFGLALITFLYVDIIDCTGTLYSMARFSGVINPTTGDFPRSTIAYCVDAFSISVGALLGTSPTTAMIESGAGIAEGGKTGLTAIATGVCFFITLFFGPIFASIPPWASGCTLILVGCMMARQITMINWRYIGDAVPAFVTILFMPFSYSIAYGLIAGIGVYVLLNLLLYVTKMVSGGRIVPIDEDHREYWTIRPPGSAPWFIRAARDPRGFLRQPLAPEDRSEFDTTGHTEVKTFGNVMAEKVGHHHHHHHHHRRHHGCMRCVGTRAGCECGCGSSGRSRSSTMSSSATPGPSSSAHLTSKMQLDSFDRAEAKEALRRQEALAARQHNGTVLARPGLTQPFHQAGPAGQGAEWAPERGPVDDDGLVGSMGESCPTFGSTTHSAVPSPRLVEPRESIGLNDLYDRFPDPQMPSAAHLGARRPEQ